MGITIKCDKTGTSCDLGYAGFARFRMDVAKLLNEEFGKHYNELFSSPLSSNRVEKEEKIECLIKKHKLNKYVVNFLFMSDCSGKCSPTACQAIYRVLKEGDDDSIRYGYTGRSDCATFGQLKALFLESSEMHSYVSWC